MQRFLNDKNYEANDINYKDKEIGEQYKIFRVNTKNELSFAKSIVVGIRDFIPKNRDKFFANLDEGVKPQEYPFEMQQRSHKQKNKLCLLKII